MAPATTTKKATLPEVVAWLRLHFTATDRYADAKALAATNKDAIAAGIKVYPRAWGAAFPAPKSQSEVITQVADDYPPKGKRKVTKPPKVLPPGDRRSAPAVRTIQIRGGGITADFQLDNPTVEFAGNGKILITARRISRKR